MRSRALALTAFTVENFFIFFFTMFVLPAPGLDDFPSLDQYEILSRVGEGGILLWKNATFLTSRMNSAAICLPVRTAARRMSTSLRGWCGVSAIRCHAMPMSAT